MKKILKGCVLVMEDQKYWVSNHSKDFLRVVMENGKLSTFGESHFKGATILEGEEAMAIIKEVWM